MYAHIFILDKRESLSTVQQWKFALLLRPKWCENFQWKTTWIDSIRHEKFPNGKVLVDAKMFPNRKQSWTFYFFAYQLTSVKFRFFFQSQNRYIHPFSCKRFQRRQRFDSEWESLRDFFFRSNLISTEKWNDLRISLASAISFSCFDNAIRIEEYFFYHQIRLHSFYPFHSSTFFFSLLHFISFHLAHNNFYFLSAVTVCLRQATLKLIWCGKNERICASFYWIDIMTPSFELIRFCRFDFFLDFNVFVGCSWTTSSLPIRWNRIYYGATVKRQQILKLANHNGSDQNCELRRDKRQSKQ